MLESALLFASGIAVIPILRLAKHLWFKKKLLEFAEVAKRDNFASGDCQIQLSVVVEAPGQEDAWNRFEGALSSLLDGNFDTMSGTYHRYESNPVATYSFVGDGEDNALKLHKQIEGIMEQETLQFHLITVKEMGSRSDIFGYRSLKEIDKLSSW